jgi:plastocyanin
VIRAEVGDTIIVDFLNKSAMPHNIHPHGLRYDKASEGALYIPYGAGARVEQGKKFRYRWFADQESGPLPGGPSSIVWMYHPHDDEPAETNAGLMGPIIITAKGKAKPDGTPTDIEREFVVLFMIFDQLQGKVDGLFYSMNGYIFGNLPGLDMVKGDRVRWHLMGMGDEADLHTAHWHGKTVRSGNRRTDVVELLPASMVSVDMLADNPGTWLFHCQVAEHMENGMMSTFTIHEPRRACPVKLKPDFWGEEERFRVTLHNQSERTISAFHLRAEYFTGAGRLLQGFPDEWKWDVRIPPSSEKTVELQQYFKDKGLLGYFNDSSIRGWAVYPTKIQYADGSVWELKNRDQCFEISWRDEDHPKLLGLPPLHPDAELPEDYPPTPRTSPRK